MRTDLKNIRVLFTEAALEIQTLGFIPRDTNLQQAALGRGRQMVASLQAERERATVAQDELSANELLLMELVTVAITKQLEMCIALKQEAAEVAWDHLVDAQAACETAIQVRRQIDCGPDASTLENLLAYLLQVEVTVFPPQAFMSIGGTVSERQCSICGNEYDGCEHIKGRAYMGKVCHTILRHVRLEEVSLVDQPANKHARVTHFSDGSGRRNKMTWRIEPEPNASSV